MAESFSSHWRPTARRAYTKVNPTLIRAKLRPAGAGYRYVDRSARPGRSYTYRLELVRLDGSGAFGAAARPR